MLGVGLRKIKKRLILCQELNCSFLFVKFEIVIFNFWCSVISFSDCRNAYFFYKCITMSNIDECKRTSAWGANSCKLSLKYEINNENEDLHMKMCKMLPLHKSMKIKIYWNIANLKKTQRTRNISNTWKKSETSKYQELSKTRKKSKTWKNKIIKIWVGGWGLGKFQLHWLLMLLWLLSEIRTILTEHFSHYYLCYAYITATSTLKLTFTALCRSKNTGTQKFSTGTQKFSPSRENPYMIFNWVNNELL